MIRFGKSSYLNNVVYSGPKHAFELRDQTLRQLLFEGFREVRRAELKTFFQDTSETIYLDGKYNHWLHWDAAWYTYLDPVGRLRIGCVEFSKPQTLIIKRWALGKTNRRRT